MFQIASDFNEREGRSFDGLTRSEHFAEVSRGLHRAGTISKSQTLAAYREMQMLEEAQIVAPHYLVGGKVCNLIEKGLRPSRS